MQNLTQVPQHFQISFKNENYFCFIFSFKCSTITSTFPTQVTADRSLSVRSNTCRRGKTNNNYRLINFKHEFPGSAIVGCTT